MTAPSPTTTPRSGGCLCGLVTFTVAGEPDFPHACSCLHCQRLSGGPVMSWVSFPLAGLIWSGGGEPSWYYTWPDSRRGFCPACGSQVCALDDGADSIAVTLSALGNSPDLVPVTQSFRETAVPWLRQVPDTSRPTDPTAPATPHDRRPMSLSDSTDHHDIAHQDSPRTALPGTAR
ncbi:GFA family protein [Streptomyces sp. NPDC047014]|uniref:GFA family protein n=1 Tax=Streptomyces sp. NPDC047014 TaxID=3155736 RepID=UPI00340FA1DC